MLALGMGMTMLTGGINLSIIAGANACSLVMAAIIVTHPDNPLFLVLALLAGAAVAVAIGTLNGALIAPGRRLTDSRHPRHDDTYLRAEYSALQRDGDFGFPDRHSVPWQRHDCGYSGGAVALFTVAILLWVLLEHTTLGRSLYLVGSNEQATRYSGVNTVRVQISVYVISALLGWVAAILMMAKFNSAKAGYGESYLLVTILASVLGGINPDGGFGRIIGTVLALIVLQMLESGLNLLGSAAI